MKKVEPKTDAFDALPRKKPLSYNKTIEAAELAQANDEKYGAPLASLRERSGDATQALKRGIAQLSLRIAITEHDRKNKATDVEDGAEKDEKDRLDIRSRFPHP